MVRYESKVVRLSGETLKNLDLYRDEIAEDVKKPFIKESIKHISFDRLINHLVLDRLNKDIEDLN